MSLETIAKRVTQLVVKNSDRFARSQKDIMAIENELKNIREQLRTEEDNNAKNIADIKAANVENDTLTAQLQNTLALLEKQKGINAELEAKLDGLRKAQLMKAHAEDGIAGHSQVTSDGGGNDNAKGPQKITFYMKGRSNITYEYTVSNSLSDMLQEKFHVERGIADKSSSYIQIYTKGGWRTFGEKWFFSGNIFDSIAEAKNTIMAFEKAEIDAIETDANGNPLSGSVDNAGNQQPAQPAAPWNYDDEPIVASVPANAIHKTENKTAIEAAMDWIKNNVHDPVQTEAGEVIVDMNAVNDSLSHTMYQNKLDAVQAIVPVLKNGKYLGMLPDKDGKYINNHYFVGRVKIGDLDKILFIRTRKPEGRDNRFYVHEIFTEDEIEKSKAAGVAFPDADRRYSNASDFYRNILAGLVEVKRPDAENSAAGATSTSATPAPESKPAFTLKLEDIVAGKYDGDTDKIDALLDEAEKEAEDAGLFEQYEDLFNQAADRLTMLLKKKQEAM